MRAWADRPGQPHRIAFVSVRRDKQDAQFFWLALLGAVRQASGATGGAELPAATPEFNGRTLAAPTSRGDKPPQAGINRPDGTSGRL